MNQRELADKAFQNLLSVFNIEKAEFKGRVAYKFETKDLPALLASLTECHEKLYRLILTTHISTIPKDERIETIKSIRDFTNHYLDRATSELVEAINDGEMVGKAFGIVK